MSIPLIVAIWTGLTLNSATPAKTTSQPPKEHQLEVTVELEGIVHNFDRSSSIFHIQVDPSTGLHEYYSIETADLKDWSHDRLLSLLRRPTRVLVIGRLEKKLRKNSQNEWFEDTVIVAKTLKDNPGERN